MRLAPRQLQRHAMTGAVPYYGGRLTPAHIEGIRQQAHETHAPVTTADDVRRVLTVLRDTGVLSPQEFDDLWTRAGV